MNQKFIAVLLYAGIQFAQVISLGLSGGTMTTQEWIQLFISAAVASGLTLHAYFNQDAPALSPTASRMLMLPTNVPPSAAPDPSSHGRRESVPTPGRGDPV